MKKFNKKMLATTVSSLLAVSLSSISNASDIEIYKLPNEQQLTLFMMFDTSGSMGYGVGYSGSNRNSTGINSFVSDYNFCHWTGSNYLTTTSVSRLFNYQIPGGASGSYYIRGCDISTSSFNSLNSTYKTNIQNQCDVISTGYRCYDRIGRLKKALITVLTSTAIRDDYRIGIGQYSSMTSTADLSNDGSTGRVVYPAVPMTAANRKILIDQIVALSAYNGTPSGYAYAESGAYMLGANTYNMSSSGYGYSHASSRNNNNGYTSPLELTDLQNECNGQGIYFLTDGEAGDVDATRVTNLMQKALGQNHMNAPTGVTLSNLSGGSTGWYQMGRFAQLLRLNKNIKTAVVGFGSVFPSNSSYVKSIVDAEGKTKKYYDCSQVASGNLRNTCNWGAKSHSTLPGVGGYGEGGFYSAQSTQDIIDSINSFIEDTKPKFDPIATGTPTIPVDALNPIELQPYGYYAKFTPKPQENYQLWLGDMNKYHVYQGELYNVSKTARLLKDDGGLNNDAVGLWGLEGVKAKLPLGTVTNTTTQVKTSNRKVFTNRQISNGVASSTNSSLTQVNLTTLFNTGVNGTLRTDPKKNYWLNILGYNVPANATGLTVDNLPTQEQRQVGAMLHSAPILLTQQGKIVVQNNQITTEDRKDYLVFGSTQGVLHVVAADNQDGNPLEDEGGKEVFAFVPHEVMENQFKGFLSEGETNGGPENLYYGLDAQWTTHTQYVSKTDGSLTVKDTDKKDNNGTTLESKGLQWLYGGMRMGGRSYYALDVGDIENPRLKFHINPDGVSSGPLSYMGQSWSKPTLTYVKWGTGRKLVMLVGGGYDTGYETKDYDQSSQTNPIGAGVYMFDAANGDLLWWASANVGSTTSPTTNSGTIATKNDNLKYSVVSQINAIDRDGDGLADNLYFGDLGGQVFRIDINNKATTLGTFAKRIVRLYNGNLASGLSPRFYEMPSFSISDGKDGMYGIVAISSGNRSSPLAGLATTQSGTLNNTPSANDGVFVIFDHDVARTTLYNDITLYTSDANLPNLNLNTGVEAISGTTAANYVRNGGWKYYFSSTAGKYKGMNGLFAVDGMLYVNVYHKDGTGIRQKCGSGVIGDTEVFQFCLPSGKCPFYPTAGVSAPNKVKMGAGILGTTLAGVQAGVKLFTPKQPIPKDCTLLANKNLPECQTFDTSVKLRHLRWYESR